jgi:hypothetical protein
LSQDRDSYVNGGARKPAALAGNDSAVNIMGNADLKCAEGEPAIKRIYLPVIMNRDA